MLDATSIFAAPRPSGGCVRVVVIWIDWYAYHLARFAGLQEAFADGQVAGIELVGGIGVHAGLKFREDRPIHLPVETLLPESSWSEANKFVLAVALWRRLRKLDPEIVLVPGYYTLPAVAAALWARLHGRASVLMTESTAEDHARTAWKEWMKSRLIRTLFDWAVVGGAAHRRYIRRLGIAERRIGGCYDVVGNDSIRAGTIALRRVSTAREHDLPSRYFLFVGRLAPEKNVLGLLDAWLDYRRGGGEWSLVLAGDGPEAPALRARLAGSSFAEDVIFTGLKSSQELLTYFAFASCFVLPSTREPWGLVVNEAMAAGLPVLVSNRCGCAEDLVENGRNGWLFAPCNQAVLTDSLECMAQLSDVERAAMGAHSAAKVASYSARNFGLQIASMAKAHRQTAQRGPAAADESRPEATA